jgi:hypothetical protein
MGLRPLTLERFSPINIEQGTPNIEFRAGSLIIIHHSLIGARYSANPKLGCVSSGFSGMVRHY